MPCIYQADPPSRWGQCSSFAEYTAAELDAQDRARRAAATAYFNALLSSHCPHCGVAIASQIKQGRSVYAQPCGHRLYQGTPGAFDN